ncbi:MAG TPA: 6-pyruvoyl-tetrahydropterin synthase-related protein [Pyrinomonadaceae bacterium]|nr:6-pyruvoyl-tetrahydropterin synthase-related protein [Pyrinomonadaceae bacterium]
MKFWRIDKQISLHILLIALFAFLAMISCFYNGVTSGNDISQHYQFAVTIRDSIASQEIYPSFSATANQGFGDFALRFYPPFSYYVLSIVYFLVQDWYLASLIFAYLVFLLGGLGTYFWAKEEYSPNQSLIAVAIFTFAPYHLNQIYNNFLFAEFASTAIIPFCFLFLLRVCQKKNKIDVLGLAIAYALLIITHLPLTIICSIVLGIYGLMLLQKETMFAVSAKLSAAVISALALSGFYWSRLITEINWVKHSTPAFFSDTWGYQNNFLLRIQNIVNFQDDVLNLWLAELMLLSVLLISIPSFVNLIRNRSNISRNVMAIGAVFLLAIFMTSQFSQFIWDHLSFLQKIQFPWRWMGIVSLFGAVFASIGLSQASKTLKTSRNILLPIGLGISIFVFAFTSSIIIRGAVYISPTGFNDFVENLKKAESFECWWTIWSKSEAFNNREKVFALSRQVSITSWNAEEREFEIEAGTSQNVRIATFYYPNWQATVNGSKVEIEKAEDGTILIPIPSQRSEVKLFFAEPFFVRLAGFISLVTWFLFAIITGYLLLNSKFGLGKTN